MVGRARLGSVLYMAAIPAGTILQYGQIPFWNPYLGGGNIFFHHPEAATFSPFLLLCVLFGALTGLKIQVFKLLLFSRIIIIKLNELYNLRII